MKRSSQNNPYPPILVEVSLLSPDKLTLSEIIKYKKSAADLLSLLILIEKIEQAFYGKSLEEIVSAVNGALDTFQENNNEQIISSELNVRLTTIAKKIREVDIEKSPVCSTVASDIVETINKTGFLVEDVIDTLIDFMKLSENACSDIGRSILSATRLLQLAAPLLTKKNPSVVELYDLIQEFRKGAVVHYDTNDPKYDDYLVAWDKWLSHHPQIIKYLDPGFVVIEPIGHTVPAVPPIIATLPHLGPATFPLNDFTGAWAGLYNCGNPTNAKAVAAAIRSHLQVGPGGVGGGVGPAHRICAFSTSGGGNPHLY